MATGNKAFMEYARIELIPVWFALVSNGNSVGEWHQARNKAEFRRNLNIALAYYFAGSVDDIHPTIRLTLDGRKAVDLREPGTAASLPASAETGRHAAQDSERVAVLWRQLQLQRSFLLKRLNRRQRLDLARRYT